MIIEDQNGECNVVYYVAYMVNIGSKRDHYSSGVVIIQPHLTNHNWEHSAAQQSSLV